MSRETAPWLTHKLPLAALRAYVEAVLIEMTAHRDVPGDETGRPIARLESSGEDAGCAWCHYVVDLSAVEMRRDSPLVVRSREGDNFLSWHLGAIPLAHVPLGWSPRETAEVLDRETLLDGFRRFVKAERVARP